MKEGKHFQIPEGETDLVKLWKKAEIVQKGGEKTKTSKPKILKVWVERIVDENPDTSTLGEFTDQVSDWAIVRDGEHSGEFVKNLPEDAELPERGREYRFFKPYACGEPEGSEYYQKYGKQDWERAEELNRGGWCYVGVAAHLEYGIPTGDHITTQRLNSAGLWGIESDSDKEYFTDIASQELDLLKEQAEAIGLEWPKKLEWEWRVVG